MLGRRNWIEEVTGREGEKVEKGWSWAHDRSERLPPLLPLPGSSQLSRPPVAFSTAHVPSRSSLPARYSPSRSWPPLSSVAAFPSTPALSAKWVPLRG